MAATVMEPASQQGSAGVDEMHQQTVALLSFKPLDKDVFDAQVAFSLRAGLGEVAKVDLAEIGARVEREAAELAGVESLDAITVQLLQAPVFHGTTASVLVELAANVEESAVRGALRGEGMQVAADGDSVSNESVAGSAEIAVAVRPARGPADGSAFWLWMAADNLRVVARSAGVCAAELAALRPGSGVN
jgi:aspartate-semialdehyde dehydrogenase